MEQDRLKVRLSLLLHELLVEEKHLPIRRRRGDLVRDFVFRIEKQSAEEGRLSQQPHTGFYEAFFDGHGRAGEQTGTIVLFYRKKRPMGDVVDSLEAV